MGEKHDRLLTDRTKAFLDAAVAIAMTPAVAVRMASSVFPSWVKVEAPDAGDVGDGADRRERFGSTPADRAAEKIEREAGLSGKSAAQDFAHEVPVTDRFVAK